MDKEILDFLKHNKKLFQDNPGNLDWTRIYDLASAKFGSKLGKFTEFWLNRKIHPENYLTELPKNFLSESSIKEFTIPDNITSIGYGAFEYCTSLKNITIPNSVNTISDFAFYACDSLTNITYMGTKERWEELFSGVTYKTVNCIDGVIKKSR